MWKKPRKYKYCTALLSTECQLVKQLSQKPQQKFGLFLPVAVAAIFYMLAEFSEKLVFRRLDRDKDLKVWITYIITKQAI